MYSFTWDHWRLLEIFAKVFTVRKSRNFIFAFTRMIYAVAYLIAASLSNRQLWSAANLNIPRALDGSSWRTKWLVQSSTTSWSSIMSPAISSSWTFSLVTLILPVYMKSRRLDNVVPSRLWMTIRSLLASSTSGKDKERHNWRGTWHQRSWRQWWSRRGYTV